MTGYENQLNGVGGNQQILILLIINQLICATLNDAQIVTYFHTNYMLHKHLYLTLC